MSKAFIYLREKVHKLQTTMEGLKFVCKGKVQEVSPARSTYVPSATCALEVFFWFGVLPMPPPILKNG